MTTKKKSFWYENSLSIMLILLFLLCFLAQVLVGWREYNTLLVQNSADAIALSGYLFSGHFLQATFENWESEFLQMFAYVIMTVYFKQKGSSESKPLYKKSAVDREPHPHPQAPWPVNKGGWILSLYKNSLCLTFLLLFFISFLCHAYGSFKFNTAQKTLENKPVESFMTYIFGSRFWFESFQNWQSEFLAVASIVIFSIFLRQYGSPESKPVDMANEHTL